MVDIVDNTYIVNDKSDINEFINVHVSSTLAERRPNVGWALPTIQYLNESTIGE